MPKINLNQLVDSDLADYPDLDLEAEETAAHRPMRRSGRSEYAILDEMAQHGNLDPVAAQAIFNPTFSSSSHEREWILNYLGPFYDDRLITDVLRLVRGGKEATVYCCAAHPETGYELIAAKIYRPRMFRNLRNDSLYRQGRPIVDKTGKEVRDARLMRAIRKGTSFGKETLHSAWMEHEYSTLRRLHEAGADVPYPLACGDNAILMEYIGEVGAPAPTLNQVRLSPEEAPALLARLLDNVDRMLACSRIHGDLSAYNVLYWQGQVKVIDFPQAVNPGTHLEAFAILQRDLERLCQYFARYGIVSDAPKLAREMWARYGLEKVRLAEASMRALLPEF